MIATIVHMIGLLGFVAIGIALIVVAHLSRRLGKVTLARPYYYLNYLAACLIWVGVAVRFFFITRGQAYLEALNSNLGYILLSDGLPALGITLGLIVTWYYWSWLVAERD